MTEITRFPELSIKILILHRNKISKIEKGSFHNLTLLEELDLSSNELTSTSLLPNVFEGHYSPSVFEPLENLKVLYDCNSCMTQIVANGTGKG